MSALRIRIKKGRDGPHSLVMIREDGSHTRQHQRTGFFPVHDLTHYAVETTLGFQRAFYGLVSEGWDLDDFGPPYPRGPITGDGIAAEVIVGYFDLERATGFELTAEDVTDKLHAWYRDQGIQHTPPIVTADQLVAVRTRIREVTLQWHTLAMGDTLELTFVPGVPQGVPQ